MTKFHIQNKCLPLTATPVALKSFQIALGLVALLEFSGCFVLLNYSVQIFTEAGSNLTPNMSAIIIGVIQIFGSYVSVHLVDKAGRKVGTNQSEIPFFIYN